MAKIKLTKTELKAQTEALKRFQRFLPMLQLKKQQLQTEIAAITAQLHEMSAREQATLAEADHWVALFSNVSEEIKNLVSVTRVDMDTANIAGIIIPVFRALETTVPDLDLFATPAWYDDAIDILTRMLSIKAEETVLTRQRDLITRELITTSQRVNLFEKVKIPECKENIRVIKIAIGDEQTASVTRGKIAKSRSGRKPAGEEAA